MRTKRLALALELILSFAEGIRLLILRFVWLVGFAGPGQTGSAVQARLAASVTAGAAALGFALHAARHRTTLRQTRSPATLEYSLLNETWTRI